MAADFDDGGSVVDEPGWGGGAACIDTSGNFSHLPPRERKAAKARQRRRWEQLRRAQAVRANWTPKMIADEEERIEAEIAEFLAARDAA